MEEDAANEPSAEHEENGFAIQCCDGRLSVPHENASKVSTSCEYFRNAFQHGMKESTDRVLHKSDWDLKTATTLIEMIVTPDTEVPLESQEQAAKLVEAADQILMRIDLWMPKGVVKGNDRMLTEMEATKVIEGINVVDMFAFSFDTQKVIKDDAWLDLMDDDILIRPASHLIRAKIHTEPKQNADPQNLLFSLMFEAEDSTFGIVTTLSCQCNRQQWPQAVTTLSDVFRIQNPSRNDKAFQREGYSMRIPVAGLTNGVTFKNIIQSNTNAKVKFHGGSSLGYYLNGSNNARQALSIYGSPSDLHDALRCLKVPLETPNDYQRCSLRITAPPVKTIQRLVEAACLCQDNPRTLGVAISTDAYFAVKTFKDMEIILKHLFSSNPPAVSIENFHLFDLTYPQGVF